MSYPLPVKTEQMQVEMEHEPTREYAQEIIDIMAKADWLGFKKDSPLTMLEIGAAWGISTLALLEAFPKARLTSIDANPCPRAVEEVKANGHEQRWTFVQQRSEYWWTKEGPKQTFDLIMVDGDHGYKGASMDILQAWGRLAEPGLLIMDDYLHPKNGESDEYGVSLAAWELFQLFRPEIDHVYTGKHILVFHKQERTP